MEDILKSMADVANTLDQNDLIKEADEVTGVMQRFAQDGNTWIHLINMVADDLWNIDQQLGRSDYWQNATRMYNIANSIKEKIKDIERYKVFEELQNVSKMIDVIMAAFASDDRARDIDQQRLNDIRIGVEDAYRDIQNLYADVIEEQGMDGMISRQFGEEQDQNDKYIQQVKKDFQKERDESQRYK